MKELQLLVNMPKNAIYALVDAQDKEIFLTYSYDVLSSLSRLISEIRAGIGLPIDPTKYEYKLLETTDKQNLKLRFNYWYDYYASLGYKFHNKRRHINYRLTSVVGRDFRNPNHRLLYVKLKNWKNEIVLGAFNNIEECNEFINNYGDLYSIKYATNQLTNEYLKGK